MYQPLNEENAVDADDIRNVYNPNLLSSFHHEDYWGRENKWIDINFWKITNWIGEKWIQGRMSILKWYRLSEVI